MERMDETEHAQEKIRETVCTENRMTFILWRNHPNDL